MASKTSILIVDDEFGVRESLKMILKPICQVYSAADGKEALAIIQKYRFDLVTLDLKMPGLSGIDVLREIKKNNPDVEVLVITGYGTGQNLQEASQLGAGEFITKPFNVPDFIKSVNKSLQRRTRNLRLKDFSLYNSLVVRN